MKKYGFTGEKKTFFGIELYRIVALTDFSNIAKGDIGGWIEKEENLDQSGNAWVSDDAQVYGNARVFGNAWVSNNSDWCVLSGFGSAYRTTTVYRIKDNSVEIVCGCFRGTLRQFEEQVKEVHGESNNGKQYLAIIELVKIRFAHLFEAEVSE